MYALFMLAYSLKYISYILNDNGLKDYETKKRKKKSKTIVEVLIKNHNSEKKWLSDRTYLNIRPFIYQIYQE